MPFGIKWRVQKLNKNLQDLIPYLEKELGTTVYPQELSVALKNPVSPKHQKILTAANDIVTAWENER